MRDELNVKNTLALVIDMQKKLMPAMGDRENVEARTKFLLECLSKMLIPTLISEQNPNKLGSTVDSLRDLAYDSQRLSKMTFSAWRSPSIRTAIESVFPVDRMSKGRSNILLFGVETHICVLQTALDLQAEGYQVFLVCDCTDSRSPYDREIAFRRMEKSGVILTTSESVVYELLKQATDSEQFREIQKIVKEAPLLIP